ncbi:MAG: hypothetical protein EOP00_00675 [Pedobacter sp.]|nr:MAG: hypothetical protein EOP00_00675 [Pedobacter sp.]
MQSFYLKTKFAKKTSFAKLSLTLLFLLMFRLGNNIPLFGVDEQALKTFFSLSSLQAGLPQIWGLYSSGGTINLTLFSLGIGPFLNASILIDLLAAVIPRLEKFQNEKGEIGRQRLFFYKKIATFFLSVIQAIFLIRFLQSYIHNLGLSSLILLGVELVAGSFLILWLSTQIDKAGIGNGSSLILFSNAMFPFVKKIQSFKQADFITLLTQILLFTFFLFLLSLSQSAKLNVEVISARQVALLQEKNLLTPETSVGKKQRGLAIKYNQVGIFPILITSNLVTFLSNLSLFKELKKTGLKLLIPFFSKIFYATFLSAFNYFYTVVFWDPEKIAGQLRKASVSLVNISPGKETILFLENVVKSTSLIGGLLLALIFILYDFLRTIFPTSILNQLMITSFMIVVGVAYDFQKMQRSLFSLRRQEKLY